MKILATIREFSSIIFNLPTGNDLELKPASKVSDTDAELVYNLPDGGTPSGGDDTIALLAETQTFSNKTHDGFALLDSDDSHVYSLQPGNLTSSITLNLPVFTSADTFAFTDLQQTISNKTLVSTKIQDLGTDHDYVVTPSNLAADRNITLPVLTSDDTFVFEDHIQTLQNKTISALNNTLSDITNANIAASGTANIALNKLAATTANRALKSDASGYLVPSDVTDTELEYLDGVTSSIQTQIDGKAGTALDNLTIASLAAEDLLVASSGAAVGRLPVGLNGQVLTVSGGAVTWDNPAGTGDVVGPGSSTDNAIARYDLTTGKVLQNSSITLSDNASLDGIALETYISEPTVDFTVSSGNTGFHPQMDIGSGRTLTIDSGAQFSTIVQLTNDGTLVNNGTIYIG